MKGIATQSRWCWGSVDRSRCIPGKRRAERIDAEVATSPPDFLTPRFATQPELLHICDPFFGFPAWSNGCAVSRGHLQCRGFEPLLLEL